MPDVLHISESVVTEKVLRRQHREEGSVCFALGAVLTPTGRDYVRQKRLEVVEPVNHNHPGIGTGSGQLVSEMRCSEPEKPFGCRSDEFGSGFAAPDSCASCPIEELKRLGRENPGCHGCNLEARAGRVPEFGHEEEDLVRQITDLVMARLNG